MEAPLLDTLVKLASLGASGICIFAIFWTGWLIHRTPPDAGPEHYRALRHYMITTVLFAVIAGASGFMNARYNAERIGTLRTELEAAESRLQEYERLRATAQGVVQTLESVINSKELAAAESRSDELQRDVATLKETMDNLSSILRD